MTTDYDFRGLLAATWDTFRGDTSRWADRFFFLDLIGRAGQPVLDVGCGTGRLLLDYLEQGIDIDGVDNSPEMLALLQRKAAEHGLSPTVYEQSMEALDLPRRYRTILVPSSALQLLTGPGQAAEAMAGFVRHLEPGGAVAAPFVTLWAEGQPLTTAAESVADQPDGSQVRRINRAWYDPRTECETTEDVFQVLREGKVVLEERHRRKNATRSYTQDAARALFSDAGLGNVALFSAFSDQPAAPADTLFTVVGWKA
jgi:ubiquinone/menaquinone biosynthesis C-methylase UbiE